MPWALPTPQQQLILELARGKYAGFNDSHLCEKLQAEENLTVSRETVRRIWRGAKLASPQKQPQESLVVYTEDWTDPPGPSDQRTPPGSRHHFATGQHRARSLLRRLQPTLRPSCRRSRSRLPPSAAPFRSRPLLGLPLPTRRRTRSCHYLGRARYLAPTLAWPSWLRRRNRRTLASARWRAARLPRKPSAARLAAALGRRRRTPSQSPLGEETKSPSAADLQSLRPPCSSGHYLNVNGGDIVSLPLIRHFVVATTQPPSDCVGADTLRLPLLLLRLPLPCENS